MNPPPTGYILEPDQASDAGREPVPASRCRIGVNPFSNALDYRTVTGRSGSIRADPSAFAGFVGPERNGSTSLLRRMLILLSIGLAVGCTASETPDRELRSEAEVTVANFLRVTEMIYTGGTPDSERAFADLAGLGIRTIVSVDGARPHIEIARRHRLRYVHIPIGYDGIGTKAGRSLARVVRETEGPWLFHCHHGLHRGPAAAAVAAFAAAQVSRDEAIDVLVRAGTSERYAGLWSAVASYEPPAEDVALPALVEVASPGSVAAAMARIQRAFENLERCRDAGWTTPAGHPDLVPGQEALLLRQGFRETGRNLAQDFDARFREWLADSERLAGALETALFARRSVEATKHARALGGTCQRCHEAYRD